ncbi:protein phosphatase 1 regulatory subunit 12A isoform X4 [Oncorhynchus kisutch]|uniref:protein phosphatase 1 regulatory subunit 12A isoform X3 n=1 Tax=Oncorhynchus kisutch TaxID=8019 RepID=UPI0012DCD6A0|nr:protein phosphatase 1 regulatory subunit 12A-like isoform X3 [Oncorhynchus kisutch]XP_031657072.1 protein phosphatase 1 regulatory subunit 12A-like isoform X4 [Oncorhynchus kisutch]
MAATDRSRSEAAKQRRQDQLQRWLGSETDQTGPGTRDGSTGTGTRRARVRFAQGAVFMAACSAGDREEVAALLRQGADINHANIDGLTALHQACIDENAEMVQFLVESGSDVNRGDNEGWTPLHAAASCGFIQITKYLIEHGAHVGAVNSEGELPLDVVTEDAMERLLKGEIKKQGVDVDMARREEERVMLADANAVLAGSGVLTPHPNTKATALHVAAAKGYIEVMKVLLQCGLDLDSGDVDGWTALHAAAHWGQQEVCSLLADNMCEMAALNNVGQTPLEVADDTLVDTLEELTKKQNSLRTEKAKLSQPPVIETSPPINMASVRPRKTSISRMSSREKICLHEREKHPPPALTSSPAEDEDEEGVQTQHGTQGQAQASSSSSSEEEEDESESDAESEKAKNREIINNLNNKRNSSSPHATSMATSTSGNTVKKQDPGKPPAPEAAPSSAPGAAPGSWRTSLRKAGSSVTLGPSGTTDPSQESTRGAPELSLGMIRSASSPRLSSDTSTDTKEPRTARVNPSPTRRLFSIPDSNPDSTSSWLSRSASYTRRLNSTGCDLSSSTPSLPLSSSCGRRLDDPTVTSTTGTGSSFSAGLSRLNILVAQRLAQEQAEKKKEQCSVTSNSVTTTTGGDLETKQRRKSYLTPVRDEEAEAQRKARSRHARQSRRSTQGVTLTDLQEADKTMKTAQTDEGREKTRKEEEEEAANKKRAEEGEVSWRSRIANLQKSDLLGLTQPDGTSRPPTSSQETSGGERESDRIARERRRTRRRAQRAGETDDNEPSGEEGFGGSGRASTRSDVSCNDCIDRGGGSETNDYKKLFEVVSRENGQLQSQLQDTQRTVSQTRLDLDKATQRQERFSDCSAMLEMEKKERRMLERRVAELEAELKVLGDLRADNQRLKDENGALIRVISKLSK